MATAPRDGSLIVALYKNQNGVVLLRWGETTTSSEWRWSSADWSKPMKTDAEYSGWMPADPLPDAR
jgi:predicted AlkP superfamily pyrophosphatase or phosphodiesterase